MRSTAIFFLLLCCGTVSAQNAAPWNGKTAAVVLTYDDALNEHLDSVVPLLDKYKLKATFYVSGSNGVLSARISEWRKAAAKGYELGNHTLYHPCTGRKPGREFVPPEYDLSTYTLRRINDEIAMTNAFLEAIDGRKVRTFAYPCGDRFIGEAAYLKPGAHRFAGARGVSFSLETVQKTDLNNISCFMVNGQTGEELIALVQEALSTNTMLVFLFHGVGGTHNLNVSSQAHRQLLEFLSKNRSRTWVPTMVDAALFIQKRKSKG
jgi:peptidoglycan-N-acetylglucosamine deacetylase